MNSYERQQTAAFHSLAARLDTPQQRIADLEQQVTRLQYQLEAARERIADLSNAPTDGMEKAFRWLTPLEFAALQGISQSTLSRALNERSGNRVVGPVIHQSNGHWLIGDRATFVPGRKGRPG